MVQSTCRDSTPTMCHTMKKGACGQLNSMKLTYFPMSDDLQLKNQAKAAKQNFIKKIKREKVIKMDELYRYTCRTY